MSKPFEVQGQSADVARAQRPATPDILPSLAAALVGVPVGDLSERDLNDARAFRASYVDQYMQGRSPSDAEVMRDLRQRLTPFFRGEIDPKRPPSLMTLRESLAPSRGGRSLVDLLAAAERSRRPADRVEQLPPAFGAPEPHRPVALAPPEELPALKARLAAEMWERYMNDIITGWPYIDRSSSMLEVAKPEAKAHYLRQLRDHYGTLESGIAEIRQRPGGTAVAEAMTRFAADNAELIAARR